MSTSFLTPRTLKIAQEIMEWAHTFLMTENPNLHRPKGGNEVCPFVEPSVASDHFYLAFHSEVDGSKVEEIEKIMLSYIEEFELAPPFNPTERLKKALIVVFPKIPDRQGFVLDVVHSRIKSLFVKRGLMVGQFHPFCDERSVHNKDFLVSRSPYPLLAIRNMAFHDIIFLKDHDDPSWFDEYNRRYGERLKEVDKVPDRDKPFLQHYIECRKRFL
jgi:hypothetical protein